MGLFNTMQGEEIARLQKKLEFMKQQQETECLISEERKRERDSLQQENAELKARVESLEQSRADLKRNNIQLENNLRDFANGDPVSKIKADAIRKMIDDLGVDDSGWYGDIEDYAYELEKDNE